MTINPIKLVVRKPQQFQAVQFDGGAENATVIIDWVLANRGTATWAESEPDTFVEGFELKGRPERILVRSEGIGSAIMISVNDVVMFDGNFFSKSPTDIFHATYDVIAEVKETV